ncbi:MAG: LytTR family transcriptional regulator [Chitinophagales bacterium]|nr:LytTR family transcriptional regulator [Chitinophagales bacterium]
MTSNGFFFIKWHNKYLRIAIQDILFIEGARNYCKIVTLGQTYAVHITIKELQDLFGVAQFVRIHKSYLVNITQVKSFDRYSLQVGAVNLPIGANFRSDFENKILII